MFEELGFNYLGPIDGHNVDELVRTLGNMRALEGPQLLHIYTTKGKGFAPAEADPVGYHAINKIEPKPKVQVAVPSQPKKPKYQDIFGQWLCDMAEQDKRLVGITPAMCEGSGMVEFSQRFPDRFHDVAICEQHAVTLAGGLAFLESGLEVEQEEGVDPLVVVEGLALQVIEPQEESQPHRQDE
jgi:1-deoxy-D-xylulose-5-phosphate synthase